MHIDFVLSLFLLMKMFNEPGTVLYYLKIARIETVQALAKAMFETLMNVESSQYSIWQN